MSRRMGVATAVLAVFAVLAAVPAPAAAVEWQPFRLPSPPGGQYSVPVGYPGDLSFWAPNRGLMTVGGNSAVPMGVYSWNGREWRQLATVCGSWGGGRIAWAGPAEFWTLAAPSPGVRGTFGALCHFRDGVVVGSYATTNVPAFTASVAAAACVAPSDCWFGGDYAESTDGTASGAFHLHWDGAELRAVYAPQGRAVSDLQVHGGELIESVFVGPTHNTPAAPSLREPEAAPALIHRIAGGAFANDPWTPAPIPSVPVDGSELHALDSDGDTAWAVGGGARSGPAAAGGNAVERPPLAVRRDGGAWTELDIRGAGLGDDEIFGDVAAIPGTKAAWATLNRSADARREGANEQPRLAHIAADGQVTVHQLAGYGDPDRGGVVRVDCPAQDDCWAVTAHGYLFRWGGSREYPVDDHPAFQGTITERPNEGAAQYVPDTPPADDSRLHAPPVELPAGEPATARCPRPPRLMSRVKPPKRRLVRGERLAAGNPRFRLTVRFRLARRARVALIAERRTGGARGRGRAARVVARTRLRTLRRGQRRLSVVVRRATWPTRLRFVLREVRRPRCAASADRAGQT